MDKEKKEMSFGVLAAIGAWLMGYGLAMGIIIVAPILLIMFVVKLLFF